MPNRLAEKWAWPGAVAVGLALAWGASLGVSDLAHGGLAPLAVAALVAAFLGVPLATSEWRGVPAEGPWARSRAALADLWSLALVGSVAAPWVARGGWAGVAVSLVLWLAVAAASRVTTGLVTPVLAGLAGAVAVGVAVEGLSDGSPWTLLELHWSTWRQWAAPAVVAGFLLPVAALGQWSDAPGPAPGRHHVPWGVAGAGLLFALLLALRRAAEWEAAAGGPTLDVLARIAGVCALLAAASAILSRRVTGRAPLWHAAIGWLATLWFAGPAHDALPLWWGCLLPLGMAVVAGLRAWRSDARSRWLGLVASAVLVAAALAGWPGVPPHPGAAAAAAATVVIAIWVAGTTALLGRRR